MNRIVFVLALVPVLAFGQIGVSMKDASRRQVATGSIYPVFSADSTYSTIYYANASVLQVGAISKVYADVGSGYVVGDTLSFPGQSGDAKVIVTDVDGNGGVVDFQWLSRGTGYFANCYIEASGGGGSNFGIIPLKVVVPESVRTKIAMFGITDNCFHFGAEADNQYKIYLSETDTVSQATLDKNSLGYASRYFMSLNYSLSPTLNSGATLYRPFQTTVQIPSTSTSSIGTFSGPTYTVINRGVGALSTMYGLMHNTGNYGTASNIKGVWATGANYGIVSGLYYAFQADIANWGYNAVGTIGTAVAGRFRVANTANDNGSLKSKAKITNATGISVSVENGHYGTLGARITTAKAIEASLNNDTADTVDTYYGYYGSVLNKHKATTVYNIFAKAPTNTGTITNYYGIYLENQTVTGATNNYAFYSNGGKGYFKDNWNAGSISIGTGTKISQVDSVKTAGGKLRWLKITMGTMAAWVPAYSDTTGNW